MEYKTSVIVEEKQRLTLHSANEIKLNQEELNGIRERKKE